MKSIILGTLLLILSAGPVLAEEPAKTIVLPASPGNVTFEHEKHIKMKDVCTPCHASGQGGKIEGFGKDMAHNVCKGCHSEQHAGPTGCRDCHHK